MKQFFRGSSIVIFFYFVTSVFSSACVAYKAYCDARNAQIAAFYAATFDENHQASQSDNILIMIFCAVLFLLLINIFDVIAHWTRIKRSEIRARMLSGGSPLAVCGHLLINYTSVTLIASVVGIISGGILLSFKFVAVDASFFFSELGSIIFFSLLLVAFGAVLSAIAIWKAYNDFARR